MWNSKPKKKDCNCHTRIHGNPKCGGGICCLSGDYRPAVRERIEGKRLVKMWKEAYDFYSALDALYDIDD